MKDEVIENGALMARELAQSLDVFCQTARQNLTAQVTRFNLASTQSIYTFARGSSDAAANVLSYEFMRELAFPMTSLPPSSFSIGAGVRLDRAMALIVSQSGGSEDVALCAQGASNRGAKVVAITNVANSKVEAQSHMTVPIGAGPELAVPATKSVVGSIAAGMALLGAMSAAYQQRALHAVEALEGHGMCLPNAEEITSALLRAQHVYVIGRDTGYGAAHEVALKLKECCALHAEAYSASEVLHGPLQLATKPLLVVMLDTESADIQPSLDQAEKRLKETGCEVLRIKPSDAGIEGLVPAAAAACLLMLFYPIILKTALALGLNPDAPKTLAKVTSTK